MTLELLIGTAGSLGFAFAVAVIGTVIGLVWGLFAGFYGGVLNYILTRMLGFFHIIPAAVLIIFFMGTVATDFKGSFFVFALAMIIFVSWQNAAKFIRDKAQQQKALDYVSIAKALGTSNIKIIFREIFPNLFPMITKSFAASLAVIIGIEIGLTLLGFGLTPELPSLGQFLQSLFI